MKQAGSFTRVIIGMLALVVMLFALDACGPRVVAGDENTVSIEAGPFSDIENFAQSYCERYGKRASLQGGGLLGPDKVQDIYYFDCVDNL